MLKKIVLLVAVISSASSVSFGAAQSDKKPLSAKMLELRALRGALADAKKAVVPAVDAARILELEGVVTAAEAARAQAHTNHDEAVATAKRILALENDEDINDVAHAKTDDLNRADRTAAVTAAEAPIVAAEEALARAVAAVATAKEAKANRQDSVQSVEAAEKNLKEADANTFIVRTAIAGQDTGEFLFVSRNNDDDRRNVGTALKTLTIVATTLVGAALAKKVVAAFKSANVKAAVGFKAKAKAFGKALNLAPRQSKLLYGSLVAAVAATGLNYGLAHFAKTANY
jgi:hypothetical protein